MSAVTALVDTVATPFPAGTVSGGIMITITGGGAIPSQTILAAPYSATFDVPIAGTYTATAQAVDAAGNALGALAMSAAFDVTGGGATVQVDVPTTVTVTQV